MSTFSAAMASATSIGQSIFGDTCEIDGTEYTCIVHAFNATDSVVPGRPRRVSGATGVVTMTLVAWTASGAGKGTQIVLRGGTFRIMNDPETGYVSDTVELQIGPLT